MLKTFLIAAGVLVASYLYNRLKYLRGRQYAHIPQLPNHLLWGHLKTFGEYMSQGIHDRHPGTPLVEKDIDQHNLHAEIRANDEQQTRSSKRCGYRWVVLPSCL